MVNMETKKEILDNLQRDCNQYSAQELQMFVKDGILEWSDLSTIYSERQLHAIYEWTLPMHQSYEGTINISQSGLEIYVWGDYKAGKTCFIGAICSVLGASGMCVPQNRYAANLSCMFLGDVCTLPISTPNCIQIANFQIMSKRREMQEVSIIDMPSSLGRTFYKMRGESYISEEDRICESQALSYLHSNNHKIHFFLMEYADTEVNTHRVDMHGLTQEQYLISLVHFLDQQRVFNSSKTLEICGVVTKCDRMNKQRLTSIMPSPQYCERPLRAFEYSQTYYSNFVNTITRIGKGVSIPNVCISFSIGTVFAQDLCEFDGTDAMKVIKHLQSILPKDIFSRLKDILFPKKRPLYI